MDRWASETERILQRTGRDERYRGPVTVLLVDDNPDFLEMERRRLEDERTEVLTAGSYDSALRRVESAAVDCVVSDYSMGRKDGLDLMRAVRSRVRAGFPFILMTARGSEDVAARAISQGVTDYVRKDAGRSPELLRNRIRNAVNRDRLQTAANWYLTVVDALEEPSFVVDADGEFVFAGEPLSELTGYPPADLIGSSPGRFLDEGDRAAVRERLDALSGDDAAVDPVEVTVHTAAGERVPCEVRLGPIREGGRVVAFAGAVRDVSDRIERERELELFGRAMDEARIGIAITGPPAEGARLRYVNDRFEALTGHDAGSVLGEGFGLLRGPETDPEAVAEVDAAVEAGEPASVDVRHHRRDGTAFWDRLDATPVHGPDGEVANYLWFLRDVSEGKRRERELTRYETIVENATDAIAVKDDSGEYRLANPAMCALCGTESVVGRTDRELFDDATAATLRRRDRDAVATGRVRSATEELTVDGHPRTVRTTRIPNRDGDGSADGVIVVHRDVTEVEEHERALAELHDVGRGLLDAEGRSQVCRRVTSAAETVVPDAGFTAYLYDETANHLEPVATAGDRPPGSTATPVDPGEDVRWRSFVDNDPVLATADGERVLVDGGLVADARRPHGDAAGETNTDTAVGVDRSGHRFVVPLGGHGVLVAEADDGLSDRSAELIDTLAATAEGVMERTARLEAVRDRERRLERLNDRLRRTESLNELIRDVAVAGFEESSREGLAAAVCERFVDHEDVSFAWVGTPDEAGVPEPLAWAGEGSGYLDAVDWSAAVGVPESTASEEESAAAAEPSLRALERASVATEPSIASTSRPALNDGWRGLALTHGFGSALAVPLRTGDDRLGVLGLYARRPDAFEGLDRSVLADLGRLVGHLLAGCGVRESLLPGERDEVVFAVRNVGTPLSELADRTGATLEVLDLRPAPGGTRARFLAEDGSADAVEAAAEAAVAVRRISHVDSTDEGAVFEAELDGESVPLELARGGARVRAAEYDPRQARFTATVRPGEHRRSVLETASRLNGQVELLARRTGVDPSDVEDRSRGLLSLTSRQREVVNTAYEAGFFEWPRDATGDEVADLLDISPPTFHEHVRRAERELFRQARGE